MARFVGEQAAPALLLRGWPRSWPHSGRKSSDLLREIALHSKGTQHSPGTPTGIERGGTCPKEVRDLADGGHRGCSAGHSSKTMWIREVGGRGRVERQGVRHLASKATALEDVHCLRRRGVVLLVQEKPRAKGPVRTCRLGSRSSALQRRWISSGRHSWLPRAPNAGLRNATTREGAVRMNDGAKGGRGPSCGRLPGRALAARLVGCGARREYFVGKLSY